MVSPDPTEAILQHIQKLWSDLGRTKMDSPEYNALIEQIRLLSAEHQAILNVRKPPGK